MVFSCISEMPPNLERTSLAESGLFVMMQVRVSYASSVLVVSAPQHITTLIKNTFVVQKTNMKKTLVCNARKIHYKQNE